MSEYKRYLMTYPIEGNIIYKSKSESKAAKRCFKEEFKSVNGLEEGLFALKDMDSKKELKFRASHGKLYRIADQKGGKSYEI